MAVKKKDKEFQFRTNNEIAKLKKKKCEKCMYSNMISGTSVMCAYILITKKRRGCDPFKCNKFKEGERIQLKDDQQEGE